MPYAPKNYDHLLGLAGFSDQLLKNHFTLYQGYVTNTNKLLETLPALMKDGKTATPEYAELTRRLGWEFNGMRLHELYFGNMTKSGGALDAKSALGAKIVQKYGSYENWEKDFKAVGAMRGIGWAVTYADPEDAQVFNCWINEHDAGHLSGAVPVLVMDVFEHAFMIDYGLKRADYISAFFKALDWKTVSKRYDAAVRK
jgi:Fe-Mn family superoxide dismutase